MLQLYPPFLTSSRFPPLPSHLPQYFLTQDGRPERPIPLDTPKCPTLAKLRREGVNLNECKAIATFIEQQHEGDPIDSSHSHLFCYAMPIPGGLEIRRAKQMWMLLLALEDHFAMNGQKGIIDLDRTFNCIATAFHQNRLHSLFESSDGLLRELRKPVFANDPTSISYAEQPVRGYKWIDTCSNPQYYTHMINSSVTHHTRVKDDAETKYASKDVSSPIASIFGSVHNSIAPLVSMLKWTSDQEGATRVLLRTMTMILLQHWMMRRGRFFLVNPHSTCYSHAMPSELCLYFPISDTFLRTTPGGSVGRKRKVSTMEHTGISMNDLDAHWAEYKITSPDDFAATAPFRIYLQKMLEYAIEHMRCLPKSLRKATQARAERFVVYKIVRNWRQWLTTARFQEHNLQDAYDLETAEAHLACGKSMTPTTKSLGKVFIVGSKYATITREMEKSSAISHRFLPMFLSQNTFTCKAPLIEESAEDASAKNSIFELLQIGGDYNFHLFPLWSDDDESALRKASGVDYDECRTRVMSLKMHLQDRYAAKISGFTDKEALRKLEMIMKEDFNKSFEPYISKGLVSAKRPPFVSTAAYCVLPSNPGCHILVRHHQLLASRRYSFIVNGNGFFPYIPPIHFTREGYDPFIQSRLPELENGWTGIDSVNGVVDRILSLSPLSLASGFAKGEVKWSKSESQRWIIQSGQITSKIQTPPSESEPTEVYIRHTPRDTQDESMVRRSYKATDQRCDVFRVSTGWCIVRASTEYQPEVVRRVQELDTLAPGPMRVLRFFELLHFLFRDEDLILYAFVMLFDANASDIQNPKDSFYRIPRKFGTLLHQLQSAALEESHRPIQCAKVQAWRAAALKDKWDRCVVPVPLVKPENTDIQELRRVFHYQFPIDPVPWKLEGGAMWSRRLLDLSASPDPGYAIAYRMLAEEAKMISKEFLSDKAVDTGMARRAATTSRCKRRQHTLQYTIEMDKEERAMEVLLVSNRDHTHSGGKLPALTNQDDILKVRHAITPIDEFSSDTHTLSSLSLSLSSSFRSPFCIICMKLRRPPRWSPSSMLISNVCYQKCSPAAATSSARSSDAWCSPSERIGCQTRCSSSSASTSWRPTWPWTSIL